MRNRRGMLLAAALAFVALAWTGAAQALTATTAVDVCAPDADPCVVSEVVTIPGGTTLDFSARALEVTGQGQLRFEPGVSRVLCGDFHAETTGAAIDASAARDASSVEAAIEARRLCSAGAPPRTCLEDTDCALGSCSVRRCSNQPLVHCGVDSNCSLGTCNNLHRCTGNSLSTRCQTNADCSVGTCPSQLTCQGSGLDPVTCFSDTDCDFGGCSVGAASMTIAGAVDGRSTTSGEIRLAAADSVSITSPIDVTSEFGNGIVILAMAGDLTSSARIRARSAMLEEGGGIVLFAGRDLSVSAVLDAAGGDAGGGFASLVAYRDITVGANIVASAKGGAGYGGEIEIDAGRDLHVGGGPRRVRIFVDGHRDASNSGGDGGAVFVTAGGDATFAANVSLIGTGAPPEGYGAWADFDIDGDFHFSARVLARTRGTDGGGGLFTANAGGSMTFSPGVIVDVRGGKADGGTVELVSSGAPVTDVDGTFLLDGDAGFSPGSFSLKACRLRLAGSILNRGATASTELIAMESMTLLPGSRLLTPQGGNILTYRTSDKPPVLGGLISPAATLHVDDTLDGCPVCGNAEIDIDETCDDGNDLPGDGCDETCQLE